MQQERSCAEQSHLSGEVYERLIPECPQKAFRLTLTDAYYFANFPLQWGEPLEVSANLFGLSNDNETESETRAGREGAGLKGNIEVESGNVVPLMKD